MKKTIFTTMLLLLAVVFVFPNYAFAQDQSAFSGNINVFLGQKTLDEDDWEPLEKQTEFGLNVAFKQQNWPVSVTLAYYSTSGDETVDDVDMKGKSTEICGGVKKIFDQSSQIRPYVAGGVASIKMEAVYSYPGISLTLDGSAIGFWAGGGVYYIAAEHFNIGLDVRYSEATVTFDILDEELDVEAGGLHYGIMVGYHF